MRSIGSSKLSVPLFVLENGVVCSMTSTVIHSTWANEIIAVKIAVLRVTRGRGFLSRLIGSVANISSSETEGCRIDFRQCELYTKTILLPKKCHTQLGPPYIPHSYTNLVIHSTWPKEIIAVKIAVLRVTRGRGVPIVSHWFSR